MLAIKSKIQNNTFLKGGFIFSSVSFLVSILNYIFNLIVARGFSLSIYGEYMSALSYFAILSVPLSAFNVIVVNKISKAKVSERPTVALQIEEFIIHSLNQYKLQVVLALLFILFFFYLKTNLLLTSILFVLISVVLNLFFIFYSSVLQAYKSFFSAGALSLALSIFKIIGGIVVVFFHPDLILLYLVIIFGHVISLFVGKKLLFHKRTITKRKIIFKPFFEYLNKPQILVPTITMFGIIGMLNVDLIFVKKFFSSADAGLYAAISLLGKIILYLTGPISLVALTFFSGSETKHNREKILLFTTLLYVFIGLSATVLYFFFSRYMVQIVFGSKFEAIIEYTWLAAIFGTLYSIVSLFAQYAISQLKSYSMVSIVGLIVQILAFYFFHNSFYDVLTINIVVMLLLITIYGINIIKYAKQTS